MPVKKQSTCSWKLFKNTKHAILSWIYREKRQTDTGKESETQQKEMQRTDSKYIGSSRTYWKSRVRSFHPRVFFSHQASKVFSETARRPHPQLVAFVLTWRRVCGNCTWAGLSAVSKLTRRDWKIKSVFLQVKSNFATFPSDTQEKACLLPTAAESGQKSSRKKQKAPHPVCISVSLSSLSPLCLSPSLTLSLRSNLFKSFSTLLS